MDSLEADGRQAPTLQLADFTIPEQGEISTKKRKSNSGEPVSTKSNSGIDKATIVSNLHHLSNFSSIPSVAENDKVSQIEWMKSAQPPGTRKKGLSMRRLQSFLKRKADVVAHAMILKLKSEKILSLLERAYIPRMPRGKYTDYRRQIVLGTGFVTDEDIQNLKNSSDNAPHFLLRAATLSGVRHTNGFATQDSFLPSSALDNRQCRDSIFDIYIGELAPMVVTHLAWKDRIQDELLSWTSSWLFAPVHLYLRHLKEQGDSYLFCIDRRRSTKVPDNNGSTNGVEFFYALDLCNASKVLDFKWETPLVNALRYRKFTHEYVTHGPVKYPEDDEMQAISYEDIHTDLFELLPELQVPSGMKACGLFEVLLYLRRTVFKRTERVTAMQFKAARNLARLQTTRTAARPKLAALVGWLSIRKRTANNKLFKKGIEALGYERRDLDEILHKGYEKIPDNLPETLSYLNLLHDVQAVVGRAPLAQAVLLKQDNKSGEKFLEAEDFARLTACLCYDPVIHPRKAKDNKPPHEYEMFGTCLYTCKCPVWRTKKQAARLRLASNMSGDGNSDDGNHDDNGGIGDSGNGNGGNGVSGNNDDDAESEDDDQDNDGVVDNMEEREHQNTTLAGKEEIGQRNTLGSREDEKETTKQDVDCGSEVLVGSMTREEAGAEHDTTLEGSQHSLAL